ncbi:hypothetical protein [Flavobacterium sp. WC2509]|uniref:hypothetical protein n=1 Tax=Flavobacterium sp. WC2509 TaxID=3461406 RepID=UPI004043BAAF
MTTILLDSNIIIRYPKFVGINMPETRLVITVGTLMELYSALKSTDSLLHEIIDEALEIGTLLLVENKHSINDFPSLKKHFLSEGDYSLFGAVAEYREEGDHVKIATLDEVVMKVASEIQVEVLSQEERDAMLEHFDHDNFNSAIKLDIQNYEQKQYKNFALKLIYGTLVAGVSQIIYENLSIIISTINIWGTIALTLLTGLLLFVFREKQRLSYGVFELVVGVIAILALFKPLGFNYSSIEFNLEFNIKLLGGLYIMVRGLDNMVKAVKNTKIGLILKTKFGIGE